MIISHEPNAGVLVHGRDTRRNALRWIDTEPTPPQRIAWYTIAPGGRCGLHRHTGKIETWLVVQGGGEAEVGDERFPVAVGDAVVTRVGLPHAFSNTGAEPLVFVVVVTRDGDAPVTTTELEP